MRRLLITLCMTAFIIIVSGSVAVKADDTFTNNGDGTMTVSYTAPTSTTILVLVENTDSASGVLRYYYKLNAGSNEMVVPLTEGTGSYLVRLCKVLADSRALVVKKWTVDLTEEEYARVFTIPSVIVNYGISDDAILKAASLTKKCKTDSDKVKKIYNYVIKNFSYDYEMLEIKTGTAYYVPSINDTYSRKLGICYDISAVMAGMLRSVGIEARIVTGYSPNITEYHAWNQIYDADNDTWYTVDGTYDMCKYDAGVKTKMKKKDSEYKDIIYTY